MVRVERVLAECVNGVHIHHIFQVFIIPCLNLLDLVRCTETVEEVDKWNLSFNCSKVGNRCQVHNFLYAGFTEHGTACLTTCINV